MAGMFLFALAGPRPIRRRTLTLTCICGAVAIAVELLAPLAAHADEIAYGYDAAGRLTSVTVAGDTAFFDYDLGGNITAIRRPGVSSTVQEDVPAPASTGLPGTRQGT